MKANITLLQSLHPLTVPKHEPPNSGEKHDASVPPGLDYDFAIITVKNEIKY